MSFAVLNSDRTESSNGGDEISHNESALVEFKLHAERLPLLHHETLTLYNSLLARYSHAQKCIAELEQCVKDQKDALMTNPVVLILIDADALLFDDAFVKQGYSGGRDSADCLHAAISTYVTNLQVKLQDQYTLHFLTRIYGNLKGLTEKYFYSGVVGHTATVEDFFRGFTQAHHHFDFIDVGPDRKTVMAKMKRQLKLAIFDYRCRQIFFGCSNDRESVQALQELYQAYPDIQQRVTLLEGIPFVEPVGSLPFHRFQPGPNLFRSTSLPVAASIPSAPMNQFYSAPTTPNSVEFAKYLSDIRREHEPHSARSSAAGNSSGIMTRSPTPSLSDFPALPAAKETQPSPWVAAVQKWAQLPPGLSNKFSPKVEALDRMVPTAPIQRNLKGQRIDSGTFTYDKDEIARVKKLKLCQKHFLRGECPYVVNCTHVHNFKPTRQDLEVLKILARMQPCTVGSSCDDVRCHYGHRCTAPKRLDGYIPKSGKTCIFGDECRFSVEMHKIDLKVVKTIKI